MEVRRKLYRRSEYARLYVSQRPLLSDVCIELTGPEGLFKTILFLILRLQKKTTILLNKVFHGFFSSLCVYLHCP